MRVVERGLLGARRANTTSQTVNIDSSPSLIGSLSLSYYLDTAPPQLPKCPDGSVVDSFVRYSNKGPLTLTFVTLTRTIHNECSESDAKTRCSTTPEQYTYTVVLHTQSSRTAQQNNNTDHDHIHHSKMQYQYQMSMSSRSPRQLPAVQSPPTTHRI